MANISGSVGKGGVNRNADVKIVQGLLNNHIRQLAPLRPLTPDGFIGPKSIAAIEVFQRKVVGSARPDGRVDPRGRTLAKLNAAPAGGGTHMNISGKALAQPAKKVLTEILQAAGLNSAKVTSVERTPGEQARVMYANIQSRGVAYNYDLYGRNGDKIIKVYEQNQNTAKEQVIQMMETKINEVGASKVSKHCSSTHYVFDVAPSSISNHHKFIDAATGHQAVTRLLRPPKDPAFHIEIPKNSLHL